MLSPCQLYEQHEGSKSYNLEYQIVPPDLLTFCEKRELGKSAQVQPRAIGTRRDFQWLGDLCLVIGMVCLAARSKMFRLILQSSLSLVHHQ